MYLSIRSRHPSHDGIRKVIKVTRPTVLRLGSTTVVPTNYREINTVQAVNYSANKLCMKEKFTESDVKTADWYIFQNNGLARIYKEDDVLVSETKQYNDITYPVVAKHIHGSRGTGNYLINSEEELRTWVNGKTLSSYILEKFYNFNREYRLHVTKEGCFYTCRKVLRADTPAENRWFRNDMNSNWIMQENPLFDKPINWDIIEQECVKALISVGLDIGAIDLRVQSATDNQDRIRGNPDFIVLETNSAASFGEVTLQKYIQKLNEICAD